MTRTEAAALLPMAVLLVAAMVLGGSARGDVAGQIVLRPLAAILLGLGLCRLRTSEVRHYRFAVLMALGVVAVPAAQLVPLPHDLWARLPGHDLVVEADRVAGIGPIMRPLTLTPSATLNALSSLLVPLAVLALGLGLEERQRRQLLPVLLAIGGAGALIGLGQVTGGADSPLYFFDFTNPGSAVGFFANRNHAAMLLAMMLPMIAVFGQQAAPGNHAGRIVAIAAGLALLPMILITGSRAGLLLGAFGLLATPFVLAPALARGAARRQMLILVGGALVVALLAFATIRLGRAEAWDRLLAESATSDARYRILPALAAGIALFFPFGSGAGSFEQAFQIVEPDSVLMPTYMNHAHNDWLEALMTGGAPAAILELLALVGFAWALRQALRQPADDPMASCFQRLGLVVIVMAGLGSIGDYPLRTPALAAVFVIAALWAGSRSSTTC